MRERDHEHRALHGLARALAAAVAFWLLDLAVLRAGVPDPLDDTWEYGVVARALLEGRGFSTPVVHPPLWSLHDSAIHVPVLVHGPLLSVMLVPLVGLAGPQSLDGVAWLAALFALFAASATYRLTAHFAPPSAAAAAALLFTCSPFTLRAVHHDIALVAGAWLLAEALAAALREAPAGGRAGLAMGLGALVRPEFLFAALPVFGIVRGARTRFALAFAACVGAWAWHGIANVGSPFFNLSSYLLIGYWGARPGIEVMRAFELPPRAWPAALAAAASGLPAKWLDFLPHALKRLALAPTGATSWLAPLGMFASLRRPRLQGTLLAMAALMVIPLLIMTATLYDARYVTPFLPIACAFVGIGAREAIEWTPSWLRSPRVWLSLLLLLVLPSVVPALRTGARDARRNEVRLAYERSRLATPPTSATTDWAAVPIVYTDTPDFVAWTTHRPSLWMDAGAYAALPLAAEGEPPLSGRDRPRRTSGDALWFHEAEGRGAPLPVERDASASPAALDTLGVAQPPAP